MSWRPYTVRDFNGYLERAQVEWRTEHSPEGPIAQLEHDERPPRAIPGPQPGEPDRRPALPDLSIHASRGRRFVVLPPQQSSRLGRECH